MTTTGSFMLASAAAFLLVVVAEFFLAKMLKERWRSRDIDVATVDSIRWRISRLILPVAVAGVTGYWYSSLAAGVAFAVASWVSLVSVGTDLSCCKIPWEPSWFGLGLGALLVVFWAPQAGKASALTSLIAVGLLTLVVAFLTRGKLGSGDVRLLISWAPLAAWAGWTPMLVGIAVAGIIQLPLRFILRRLGAYGGPGLPFAPALVLGTFIAILWLGHPGTPCSEWANVLTC